MRLPAELTSLLSKHTFGWLGQRALDCVGLDEILSFELILCCDYGTDTKSVASRTGAHIISLEFGTAVRRKWSNFSVESLFKGDMAPQITKALLSHAHGMNVLAYTSTRHLEKLASLNRNRVQVLAPRVALKRFFDDKIRLRKMLPHLGIEPVPGHVDNLEQMTFEEMEQRYGTPFVIQFPVGSAGARTFFISSKDTFESLQCFSSQEVIVSKYIQGPAPNINVVVLDHTILLSYPSLQLIGIERCTDWPAAYCGNDFSATECLTEAILEEIYRQARRIGGWLREDGYRGLFGVDFVTDGAKIYPVEINPRFQGSTHVLTQTQVIHGQPPLALAHVLTFLEDGKRYLQEFTSLLWEEPQPLQGAQIVLHRKKKKPGVVQGVLKPGVYTFENEEAKYKREGVSLIDCRNQREFVVNCAVPRVGTRVESEAPLLKIQTLRSVLDAGTGELLPWARRACDWAYSMLAIE
jgi:predicted ATP-grasp superfamily ATP-dependent carboligase